MKKLNLDEDKLFRLFKRKYIDIIRLDEYSAVDFFIPSNGVYLEVKCRNKHYDTLFLEKIKYDKLIEYEKCYYICSTPDGIWGWNIKKLNNIIFKERKMNKSTHYMNRYNVKKLVAELDIKDGVNITNKLIFKKS